MKESKAEKVTRVRPGYYRALLIVVSFVVLFYASLFISSFFQNRPTRGHQRKPYLTLPRYSTVLDYEAYVLIPGGQVELGIEKDSVRPDACWPEWSVDSASPRVRVVVEPFEMAKYEVTAAEFCEFLNDVQALGEDTTKYIYVDGGSDGYKVDGAHKKRRKYRRHDHQFYQQSTILRKEGLYVPRSRYGDYSDAPALHVQFLGARRYCEWLSEKTGQSYRLPSEAEWEWAARGPEGSDYPWGEETPLGRAFLYAHYAWNLGFPCPEVWHVGQFQSGESKQGVYDLIGNGAEWCGNAYFDYSKGAAGLTEALDLVVARLSSDTSDSDDGVVTVYRGRQFADWDTERCPATTWMRFQGGQLTADNVRFVSFRPIRDPVSATVPPGS